MLKTILRLKGRLAGARAGNRAARKGGRGARVFFDALEGRCVPSLTVGAPGLVVSTFAPAPNFGVKVTSPDSIAVDGAGAHVFVGYSNGTAKDGSDDKFSTILEYNARGTFLHSWQVPGHNDGLKIDPLTGNVWALQNEDGNPNLAVINPRTGREVVYAFPRPDNGGTGTPGGYDDITFLKGNVYLTESNPDPTSTGSAVVQVKLPRNSHVRNPVIIVRQVVPTNATATDASGQPVRLNLSDPDSMTASGNSLVFTSSADDEVLTVHNPGPGQFVTVVKVHDAANDPVEVDDTLFTPGPQGAVLVVDSGGTVYEVTGPAVNSGLVLSSGDASKALGTLDTTTGLFTPVITGFSGQPKGLAFLPTRHR